MRDRGFSAYFSDKEGGPPKSGILWGAVAVMVLGSALQFTSMMWSGLSGGLVVQIGTDPASLKETFSSGNAWVVQCTDETAQGAQRTAFFRAPPRIHRLALPLSDSCRCQLVWQLLHHLSLSQRSSKALRRAYQWGASTAGWPFICA